MGRGRLIMTDVFYMLVDPTSGHKKMLAAISKHEAKKEGKALALLEAWHHAVIHTYTKGGFHLVAVCKI
jgi:hypothetical protein